MFLQIVAAHNENSLTVYVNVYKHRPYLYVQTMIFSVGSKNSVELLTIVFKKKESLWFKPREQGNCSVSSKRSMIDERIPERKALDGLDFTNHSPWPVYQSSTHTAILSELENQ